MKKRKYYDLSALRNQTFNIILQPSYAGIREWMKRLKKKTRLR